jgi:ActD protein
MAAAHNAYAVLAEFSDPAALLEAVRACRRRYRDVEAYTPYPIEGLAELLGFHRNAVPLWTLLGGLLGGAGAYFLQWYSAVIDYPINSGGRPLHAWPAFIPATFEMTVLGAALAAFFGFVILNGLPRLYHPVFNAREFDLASRNRFFLCIRASDRQFERGRTQSFLQSLPAQRVMDVES